MGQLHRKQTKDQEYKVDSSGTGNEVQAQLINIKALINLKYCHISVFPVTSCYTKVSGGVTIYSRILKSFVVYSSSIN